MRDHLVPLSDAADLVLDGTGIGIDVDCGQSVLLETLVHMIYIMSMYIKEGAMQVAKWGNSLAVRLPASVVEALELKEGDNVEIHVATVRSFGVAKSPSARELLARLRKYRGRLPASFKFDRLEANERR
jgi:antitoxin MazE